MKVQFIGTWFSTMLLIAWIITNKGISMLTISIIANIVLVVFCCVIVKMNGEKEEEAKHARENATYWREQNDETVAKYAKITTELSNQLDFAIEHRWLTGFQSEQLHSSDGSVSTKRQQFKWVVENNITNPRHFLDMVPTEDEKYWDMIHLGYEENMRAEQDE